MHMIIWIISRHRQDPTKAGFFWPFFYILELTVTLHQLTIDLFDSAHTVAHRVREEFK